MMSKEIKEKCKLCVYYDDKQQYPDVEGATTHSNCLSLKCQYRKMTKDMQIGELKNKVADLEAKLAEYEKELMDNEKCFTEKDVEGLIKDREQTIKFLKQQLAEKDEENLILFSMLYETLEKQGYENITSTIEQMTNLTLEKQSNWLKENCVKNQDKISFAVEQLSQVKKLCKEKFDWWENSEWEGNVYDKFDVSNAYFDIEANIDEKITQLTHQHEHKGE